MSKFLGAIRSKFGIVLVVDADDDPNQQTAVFPIDSKCVVAAFRGKDGVKDFVNKHIVQHKGKPLADIVTETTSAFAQHYKSYIQQDFSFFIAGYENGQSSYHSFWFDNGVPTMVIVKKIVHFINTVDDLVVYLISKVYSEYMSLEEIKKLMGYVLLQCVKVFGFDTRLNFVLISKKGVKSLTEEEINDILNGQDKVDHKLKKLFTDFFVKGEESL